MHSPLLSVALQNRLTAGLCDCNYTYGDLLFIQVCSDPKTLHCSTGQGKMHFQLLSVALQNRLTAGCVNATTPMESCCSCRCAVTQHHCTAALVRAKCTPLCSVLLCKTGSQQACVTAITPMEMCCSYRGTVTQHHCTAALVLAKCTFYFSVLLCKTGSQQVV